MAMWQLLFQSSIQEKSQTFISQAWNRFFDELIHGNIEVQNSEEVSETLRQAISLIQTNSPSDLFRVIEKLEDFLLAIPKENSEEIFLKVFKGFCEYLKSSPSHQRELEIMKARETLAEIFKGPFCMSEKWRVH